MDKWLELHGDSINRIYNNNGEIPLESDGFSQLLIYKGNLTEAELKAELAKNIKII